MKDKPLFGGQGQGEQRRQGQILRRLQDRENCVDDDADTEELRRWLDLTDMVGEDFAPGPPRRMGG